MTELLRSLREWSSPFPAARLAEAPSCHTMDDNLVHYVLPKCPSDLLGASRHVRVTISHNLADLNGTAKLDGKAFNWRRPKFEFSNGTLTCTVSPGTDYVYHYARLLGTACQLLGVEPTMEVGLPEPDDAYAYMDRWLPASLPQSEVVILGYVERLLTEEGGAWQFESGFGWRHITVKDTPVLMLGCEFSYWGDLAGALVSVLASRGTTWVVYVGKLGTLNQADVPNRHVATGASSLVEGENVCWESHLNLEGADSRFILTQQRHATTPSIIDETRRWYEELHSFYDLVDPEIGRMANAANAAGIWYDYLHVVTDNLSGHHEEGLYFERHPDIMASRLKCLNIITAILRRSL